MKQELLFNKIEEGSGGTYLVVGYHKDYNSQQILLSKDNGDTWTTHPISNIDYIRNNMSVNLEGDHIILLGKNSTDSFLYESKDYGQSWSKNILPNVSYTINVVKASEDHKNIITSHWGNDGAVISRDYGDSWNNVTLDDTPCCAVSKNGQYMYLSEWGNDIFYSDDYGKNWTELFSVTYGSYIGDITCNNDGSIIVIKSKGGYSDYSLNYGSTWNMLYATTYDSPNIVITPDGERIIGINMDTKKYKLSTDYGSTFTERDLPSALQSASNLDVLLVPEGLHKGQVFMYDRKNSGKVYRLNEIDYTWVEAFSDPEGKVIRALSADDTYLYIVNDEDIDGSIYRMSLATLNYELILDHDERVIFFLTSSQSYLKQ